MDENNKFIYTYSSQEKEEIEKIRQKYTQKAKVPSHLDQIRKLDKSVTSTATVVALIIGIVGTLIFGAGFSLVLVWGENLITAGIIVGILGMGIAAAAYPAFLWVYQKKKEKIAPIIIKLSNEISNK